MQINGIELRHLRCLVMLAEELNFGRAAERLNMSQPPLTRIVADMEKALGVKLFARTTRRVALTPIGALFVAEAAAVLARMDAALETVGAAIARQNGLLRLAYVPFALQTVLPGILAAFRAQEHDARIDLIEMPGPAQQGALLSGWIDFAFCDMPPTNLGVDGVRLYGEELSLLVPEAHPLAGRKAVSLADLAGETLIMHPRGDYPEYFDRIEAACQNEKTPPTLWERPSGQNCLALVMSGAGLLLSPGGAHSPPSGLRRITLRSNPPLRAEIWAVWTGAGAEDRVRTLAEIAKGASLAVSG